MTIHPSAPGISRTRSWDAGPSLCSSPQVPRAQRGTVHSHLRVSPLDLWPSHTLSRSLLPILSSALCSNTVLSITPDTGSLRGKPLPHIFPVAFATQCLQPCCHYLGACCLSLKCQLESRLPSGLRTGTKYTIRCSIYTRPAPLILLQVRSGEARTPLKDHTAQRTETGRPTERNLEEPV